MQVVLLCCAAAMHQLATSSLSLCRSNQGNSPIKCRPPEQSRACLRDPNNPGLGTPRAPGHTIGDNGH